MTPVNALAQLTELLCVRDPKWLRNLRQLSMIIEQHAMVLSIAVAVDGRLPDYCVVSFRLSVLEIEESTYDAIKQRLDQILDKFSAAVAQRSKVLQGLEDPEPE